MVFHLNEIMISDDENLQIRLFDLMTTYSTMVNDQFCFNFLLRTCRYYLNVVCYPTATVQKPLLPLDTTSKKESTLVPSLLLANHYIYYIHSSSRGNWEFTGACPIFSVRERAVLCEWSLARNDNV